MTDKPTRNVALLEQTMQHILDDPEHWYQGKWFSTKSCGTAACFAGWACILSGYDDVIPDHSGRRGAGHTYRYAYYYGTVLIGEDEQDPSRLARKLLGLTLSESSTLFAGYNTIPMLELMVKDLVNGDEMRPYPYYREMVEPHIEEENS